MKLKLEYPPTPEFGALHAKTIVSATQEIHGKTLDYSAESMKVVDEIILNFRNEGISAERIPSTVFRFGCYAGEVIIRQRIAAWVDPKLFVGENELQYFPFMVVRFPDRHIWNPIMKAFAMMENGSGDSLEFSCSAELLRSEAFV